MFRHPPGSRRRRRGWACVVRQRRADNNNAYTCSLPTAPPPTRPLTHPPTRHPYHPITLCSKRSTSWSAACASTAPTASPTASARAGGRATSWTRPVTGTTAAWKLPATGARATRTFRTLQTRCAASVGLRIRSAAGPALPPGPRAPPPCSTGVICQLQQAWVHLHERLAELTGTWLASWPSSWGHLAYLATVERPPPPCSPAPRLPHADELRPNPNHIAPPAVHTPRCRLPPAPTSAGGGSSSRALSRRCCPPPPPSPSP